MLTIWGRTTSSNVQKVLWCCAELDLAYERIEAGREFGKLGDPAYRAMNPNGLVPTLVDGDLVIWESQAILRYLCNRYSGERLYSADPARRSQVDQWLDWNLTVLGPATGPLFWSMVRTPEAERDPKAVAGQIAKASDAWSLVDRHLANRPYVAGDTLSLADIAYGNTIRRWYSFAIERPALPALAAWYERLGQNPGFRTHIMTPVV